MNRYTYNEFGKVIPEVELESEYPNILSYLKNNRDRLKGRSYFDSSNKLWFELWNQRNLVRFKRKKIVTLDNSKINSFALDEHGLVGTTTVYSLIPKKEYNLELKFLLGVLNSSTLEYFHKNTTIPQASGFFRYQSTLMHRLPIKIPPKFNQQKVAMLVDEVIEKKSKDNDTDNLEENINTIIYQLYELNKKEIQLIEDLWRKDRKG